jgi:hypothetical protein
VRDGGAYEVVSTGGEHFRFLVHESTPQHLYVTSDKLFRRETNMATASSGIARLGCILPPDVQCGIIRAVSSEYLKKRLPDARP